MFYFDILLRYGGTNAHVVLEETPKSQLQSTLSCTLQVRPPHFLVLSAHNKQTLDALAKQFAQFLQDRDDTQLHNIS